MSFDIFLLRSLCGEGGIRTPGTVARSPHFECGPIDHSGTSPFFGVQIYVFFCYVVIFMPKIFSKIEGVVTLDRLQYLPTIALEYG